MSPSIVIEIDALRKFASERVSTNPDLTLEDCVREFRAQQQLARFKDRMEESLAQARRGESGPLDAAALKRRVRERLEAEGIRD